jgi:hypothetical protein
LQRRAALWGGCMRLCTRCVEEGGGVVRDATRTAHARLQRRVLQVHLKALGAVRSARAAAARRRTQQVARQRLNGW